MKIIRNYLALFLGLTCFAAVAQDFRLPIYTGEIPNYIKTVSAARVVKK